MDGQDSVHKGGTMEIIRKLRGLLWVDIWGYENALARIWNLLLAAFDKRDKEQVEEREKRRDVVPQLPVRKEETDLLSLFASCRLAKNI